MGGFTEYDGKYDENILVNVSIFITNIKILVEKTENIKSKWDTLVFHLDFWFRKLATFSLKAYYFKGFSE